MASRGFAALLFAAGIAFITGCGTSSSPEPAAPPAPVVDNNELLAPDPGPVKWDKGEPPPKPKRQPRPGEIVVPEDGGKWPGALSPAPAAESTRPVTIGEVKGWVTGFAVAPAARVAVVTLGDAPFDKTPPWTRVVLCDLAEGKVITEWEVREKFDLLDLSADGRRLLLRRSDHNAHDILHLWTIGDELALKRKNWRPHDRPKPDIDDVLVAHDSSNTSDDVFDVRWAGFAGTDRIVTVSKPGQFRVWHADTLKQIGTTEAVPAVPAVSPDGKRVLFLTPGGVAVLDLAEAKVVGAKPFQPPEGERVLAISPDGKTLACTGNGRVRFLDLAEGEFWDAVLPKLGDRQSGVPRSFGWAGNKHLLTEGLLFDPDVPIPVWHYNGADHICFRGRQVWALTRAGVKDTTVTVRAFTLPHRGAEETIAAKLKSPTLFVLRPGDGVAIDVTGIPTDKQPGVRDALKQRLTSVGYRPNDAASAVLFAFEEKIARKRSAEYVGSAAGKVEYLDRPARLKLVKDGRVLWEAESSIGPSFSVWLAQKPGGQMQTLQDKADEGGWGRPDYGLFRTARIPPLFPGREAPSSGFGHHEFTPAGLKEWGPKGKIVE